MPLKYTDGDDREKSGGGETTPSFTVEQAIERVGIGWLQLQVYVVCKLIVATDAMEVMLLSLVGPVVQCEWNLRQGQVAFISTAVFFGMAVSSPLMGLLADHYGRRTSLLYSTLWTAYFGLLTCFCPSYIWLLLIRGLVGVGMGGIPQGYAMVAEYVPSRFRAKMIVFGEAFWACGAMFEILLAAFVTPTLGWRWLFGFSAIPVLISFILCLFIPESTRYLLAADQREDALTTLQRIAIANKTSLPRGTLVRSKQEPRGSIRDLFCPEQRRTTLLLWPIWFGISFSYYGIVLASPLLLTHQNLQADDCSSTCHVLESEDYISLATSTLGEFVGLFFSCALIDRIGRRRTGIVLLLAATVFLLLLQLHVDQTLITLFTFGVRGSTLTLFNLIFIYTVEVYPTTMRALALGIATAWARFASMITPFFAQMLMVYSVPITVVIYGCVCLVCAVLMYLLPIETMGRPMMMNHVYRITTVAQTSEAEGLSYEKNKLWYKVTVTLSGLKEFSTTMFLSQ